MGSPVIFNGSNAKFLTPTASANNFLDGYATTVTAAGTTTLVSSSKFQQYFTGTTTQTVVLPVTSTLVLGQQFLIVNNSTGIVTVQSSGANTIQAMAAGTSLLVTCILTSGTTAASWNFQYQFNGLAVSNPPTVQKFLIGSGTYTTPANVQFIRVRMVGGGGGGGGGGGPGATNGSSGGNSTFGTTLLVANGGSGGNASTAGSTAWIGGAGGTASLGTGPIGTAVTGGGGAPGFDNVGAGSIAVSGGNGGSGIFGGAGAGGTPAGASGIAGTAGAANTGAGGGGGSSNSATSSGGGGGSGGGVDATLLGTTLAASFPYQVGSAGVGGSAGTNGTAAGNGALGYIEVTEYYFNSSMIQSLAASIQPTIQKFTSGSGTYTTPAGVQYIRVRMVGAGGGGSGGTNTASAANAGGAGGNTTFGTALLVANGGSGAPGNLHAPGGAGGTASLGTGPIGTAISGAHGQGNGVASTGAGITGGNGGNSFFGGGGGGGSGDGTTSATAGTAGATNTGGGGGGGGSANGNYAGDGGGAGGFVDAIISGATLAASFPYSIGVAGTAGTGQGSGAVNGGAGALGYIEVTEYYTNLAIGNNVAVAANQVFASPASGSAATPNFRNLVYADVKPAASRVIAYTPNGHGSTGTTTRTWANSIVTGTDITYTSSATNGDSFTINTSGVYSITWNDNSTSAAIFFGVTINGTNNVSVVTQKQSGGTGVPVAAQVPAASVSTTVSCTIPLNATDVIRGQDDGGLNYTNSFAQFIIQRIL